MSRRSPSRRRCSIRGPGPIFRPKDGERLELRIENEPPMDLMTAKPDEASVDYDFELLYRVAKDLPLEPRLPMLAVAAVSGTTAQASAPHNQAECDTVQYNDSGEANGAHNQRECDTVQYNDSKEAFSGNMPACVIVQYDPSREAVTPHSVQLCSPVQFNPNQEADILSDREACPILEFNPSEEAGGRNRVICPFVGYNPNGRA